MADVFKKHGKLYVWVEGTGFCPITEKRLNQVVSKFHMTVRVKKRPVSAILSKGGQSITFDNAEDLAREILQFQGDAKRRRNLFKAQTVTPTLSAARPLF